MRFSFRIVPVNERRAMARRPEQVAKHQGDTLYRAALRRDPIYRIATSLAVFSALVAGSGLGPDHDHIRTIWVLMVAFTTDLFRQALRKDAAEPLGWVDFALDLVIPTLGALLALGVMMLSDRGGLAAGKAADWLPHRGVFWEVIAASLLVPILLFVRRLLPLLPLMLLFVIFSAGLRHLVLGMPLEEMILALLVWVAGSLGQLAIVTACGGIEATIATVALLQLGGLLLAGTTVFALVPPLPAILIEAVLLIVAAHRDALAQLATWPRTTDCVASECVVPALDHAQDFPARIDVA